MNLMENKQAGPVSGRTISRRRVLFMGLTAVAFSCIPYRSLAAVQNIVAPERRLCFYNPYTGEKLDTAYWREGRYIPEGIEGINYILRDIRTGKVKDMDRKLLDLLFALNQELGNTKPFHIISGYRTPRSNALLRKRKKGVAKNSLHIYGKAVDIHVPSYDIRDVRRAAIRLRGGGVGYYPHFNSLHIDVGSIRYWRG